MGINKNNWGQNQNERIIMVCEREMQRKDISESRRDEILERMTNAAKSTAYANTISKEFQNRYLELLYKQPWEVTLLLRLKRLFLNVR